MNFITLSLFQLHLRLRSKAALISEAVRSPATRHAPVIGNPYDPKVFFSDATVPPAGTIMFSGRINRGKGVFDVVAAAQILRSRGLELKVTFVGSGPDEGELRLMIENENLQSSISLLGHCEPDEVATLLRHHQIAVVPSQWDEPFGIVALEAIACGCYVVAYADGGLPEAVGDAGFITKTHTPAGLANAMQRVMNDADLRRRIDTHRAAHLERFTPRAVVYRLIEVIRQACRPMQVHPL